MLGSVEAVDIGDLKSSTLTTKAWNAFSAQQDSDTLAYISKCVELYGTKAKEMQSQMSSYASGPEAAKKWALNDVGTCLFIKGELLSRQGDAAGAVKAYQTLVNDYKYAQTWDTKGWFWKPAEAAKQKIVELSMEL